LSRHISRAERWIKKGHEEYVCDEGVVHKDQNSGCKTWVGLVKNGFGYKVIGRGFKRARNAMIAVEDAAKKLEREVNELPPIHFHAHVFPWLGVEHEYK
jgi:hypothetical protein